MTLSTIKSKIYCLLTILFLLGFVSCSKQDNNPGEQLYAGFQNPPNEAKPRVWWHWMNGNVTKDGIKKDLEWMKRVGIGGFQNFDAGLTTPKIVDNRLVYMTPEWKDAFLFATKLADSLGLEMGIAGSPGWSESGGPWVKPEEAMKKYVWSEVRIEGGKPFNGVIPQPPTTTGSFQNIKSTRHFVSQQGSTIPEFYKDAALIAFKIPDAQLSLNELQPKITSSGGNFVLNKLIDGDLTNTQLLTTKRGTQDAWIQFEFQEPVTIHSLSIVASGASGNIGPGAGTAPSMSNKFIEVSDDGKNYRKISDILASSSPQMTIAFEQQTAKYFRIVFKNILPPNIPGISHSNESFHNAGIEIAELVLCTEPMVNRFEEKAGFVAATNLEKAPTPASKEAIQKSNVIDLTSQLTSDGKLSWTPPEGNWKVIRLGYSLIGRQNGPASPEATGLEVDKMSAEHVRSYFTNYLNQYADATKGLMGEKGLQFMITDSWEAGCQNWTDDMISEFKKRRGYDLIQWLPVLSGYVVESAEASDKFLWDFRRTISEMIAQNHYDILTEILEGRGMGRYSEAHEAGRALVADGMEIKKNAAVPMAALWTPSPTMFGENVANFNIVDIKESASVSHIYGPKYVAAESLTAVSNAWGYSPDYLKTVTDVGLACGLNRYVIHCSVHQPVDDKIPGLGLGPYGQWFTRHETWAEQSRAWMDYLARSCYMMQQGKFIADVIYFYGEDDNITAKYMMELPPVPAGYDYDFTNADALINTLSVKDNSIVTPTGMQYKLLALDKSCERMTLPVLKKIKELVYGGAVVVGEKPLMTPSLSDNEEEFTAITNELWAGKDGINKIGNGFVYAGKTIGEVLNELGVEKDFSYEKSTPDSELLYIHRKYGDIDYYWVNNRSDNAEDIEITCRVSGKVPEIWHPETGKIENTSYSIENGHTKVNVHLNGKDALFIVFRNNAEKNAVKLPKQHEEVLTTMEGPWVINFQEDRGAPVQAVFETLTPWNESEDLAIKYFSGLGSYTKTINVSPEWLNDNSEIILDLGNVKSMAEIFVNDQSVGIVWRKPSVIDLTNKLNPGENKIEIQVANLWVNRLVGDAQPNVENKITYTAMPFYQASSPLKESGLLGPVRILSISNQ